MKYHMVFGVIFLISCANGQYASGIDHEEEFQSAEPIAIFARSRVTRGGGGYGSAPVEILPVPGPSYSNQQIESLPNYGAPEPVAPIKQEPYSSGSASASASASATSNGYGGPAILEPIKQEPYSAPTPGYGGAAPLKPVGPVGGGYGAAPVPIKQEQYPQPLKPVNGYGSAPLKQDFGTPGYAQPLNPVKPVQSGYGSAPLKQDFGTPGYAQGPVQSYGGGHRQPHGYSSGSGISFGHSTPSHTHNHGHSPSGYGQPSLPVQQKPAPGYGSTGHVPEPSYNSYSKPPVVQPGYGVPLSAPPQKAPTGYGR